MKFQHLIKLFLVIAFAVIAFRLHFLVGLNEPKGIEIAAYYVAFFWSLTMMRNRAFCSGLVQRNARQAIVLLGIYVGILIFTCLIERKSALDVVAFDRNAVFLAALSVAYVAMALVVAYGTSATREAFRKKRR